MATLAFTTPAMSPRVGMPYWLARIRPAFSRADAALLTACAEFHRLERELARHVQGNEDALTRAWDARQRVVDQVASLRPSTDAGRRAKAAVALALLNETANWERTSEWGFAVAAFRAEARA